MNISPSLAAVLIVKNEAEQLAQCLTSLENFVDEIVILDGGSDDNTLEIASRFTEKTYVDTHGKALAASAKKHKLMLTVIGSFGSMPMNALHPS